MVLMISISSIYQHGSTSGPANTEHVERMIGGYMTYAIGNQSIFDYNRLAVTNSQLVTNTEHIATKEGLVANGECF